MKEKCKENNTRRKKEENIHLMSVDLNELAFSNLKIKISIKEQKHNVNVKRQSDEKF